MSRSPFKLESVLRYREQLVDLRQQELGALEQKLFAEKAVLDRLNGTMATAAQEIRACQQSGALNCDELMARFRHLEHVEQLIQQQVKQIAETQLATEAKRSQLRDAMQDKQVLDKLKERQLAQQQREEVIKEGMVLDEMGVMRFFRSEQAKTGGA